MVIKKYIEKNDGIKSIFLPIFYQDNFINSKDNFLSAQIKYQSYSIMIPTLDGHNILVFHVNSYQLRWYSVGYDEVSNQQKNMLVKLMCMRLSTPQIYVPFSWRFSKVGLLKYKYNSFFGQLSGLEQYKIKYHLQ